MKVRRLTRSCAWRLNPPSPKFETNFVRPALYSAVSRKPGESYDVRYPSTLASIVVAGVRSWTIAAWR